jgi:hypothetical protein
MVALSVDQRTILRGIQRAERVQWPVTDIES